MSLLTNLVSHWKLDEASGNALDAHGTNTLTETSGTIGSAAGKVGNARDFEAGDTEYFELSDNTDLSTGDVNFHVACWVWAETLTNFPVIAHKGWQTANDVNKEWVLFYDTTAARFTFSKMVGTTLVNAVANNFGVASVSTWYRLDAWHDADNNVIGIAVNNGTANTTATSTGVNNGNRAFQVGASSSQGLYWDGLIDELSFYKHRVLSSAEIAVPYNSGNGLAYPWSSANRRRRLICGAAA